MITTDKQRQKILDKIKNIPAEKLNSVELFIENLEKDNQNEKSTMLAFAGMFKDLDKDLFSDLTENLQVKRTIGDSRIPEF